MDVVNEEIDFKELVEEISNHKFMEGANEIKPKVEKYIRKLHLFQTKEE
jgi:hypothetical protein